MTASPVRRAAGGVTVAVRLTPKAAANRIDGVAEAEDGARVLQTRVTAAPEGGKANAALLRLLAKSWKLPKSALCVAAGGRSRRKTIHVAGAPAALAARLTRWIEENHG